MKTESVGTLWEFQMYTSIQILHWGGIDDLEGDYGTIRKSSQNLEYNYQPEIIDIECNGKFLLE